MSFNITFRVETDAEGKKNLVLNETASYLDNAPDGQYTISGHHVGENDGGGYESIGVSGPSGSAQGGYRVPAPVVAETPVVPDAPTDPVPTTDVTAPETPSA